MTLKAGGRLGAYEIVAAIGAGGMGEVYRARDTRLNRSVAIKVLPAEFSTNAQLKLRFEREAQTISQLNHPNICTLYDVGHDSGIDYLVMEMLEGETLADRIERGPLPLADVIRYGAEIAEALEKAHRAGIVHRDLKPGNIMLTKSGAKLLDFGLARSGVPLSERYESATLAKPLTEEGVIVGTYRYMSPEQLGGDTVDHRSDIFAFGAVLYEMITGRRAFDGKTRTSIVAAIVAAEPAPISELRPLTPPALERLIRACLAKDPDARIQSAHDAAFALQGISEGAAAVTPRAAVVRWLVWSLATLFALLALVAIAYYRRAPTQVALPVRFTIPSPPNTALEGIPAVSPDGRSIIFRTASDSGPMLWIRSLDSIDAKPLKGTEGASSVFWSPDGKRIAFTAARKLWTMDLHDGSVHALYGPIESLPGGATWSDRDVILFSPRSAGQLYRIAASGGEAVRVGKGNAMEVWPSFLPDGDHFLFFRREGGKPSGIAVGSLSSDQWKLLIPTSEIRPLRAAYASGYVVYDNVSVLLAQKFDVDKLELAGPPQQIEDNIEYVGPGRAAFAVSAGGTLIYHDAGPAIVSQLSLVDSAGRETAKVGPVGEYTDFRISPDDKRIVFMRWFPDAAAWILDVERGASTRATFERFGGFPVWMPDGRAIVYSGVVDEPPNLFLRHANGTTEALTHSDTQWYPTTVTPDGKLVIAERSDAVNDFDLVAVPVAPPHTAIPILQTKFRERGAVASPDGKWLAFISDESGHMQVYAMPIAGGAQVQVSIGAGRSPRWSRDGRHVYYIDPIQKKMMDAPMKEEDGELHPAAAVPLFSSSSFDYDVTRDGRFLVAKQMVNPDAPPMTVVMNWTATLR